MSVGHSGHFGAKLYFKLFQVSFSFFKMPRVKKTRKYARRAFTQYARRRTAYSNMRNLVNSAKALSNGSQMPISDMYDGLSRRLDIVPTKIPRNISDQIVWSRIILDTQTAFSAVAEINGAALFRLNQHPEASSFAAIFDQYCIPAVVAEFRTSENTATSLSGAAMPRYYTVLDHDDANTITVAQCKEYSSCQEQRCIESVTRIVYPRVAVATYAGAFTGFGNQRMWLDCGSDAVQHYGIKYAAEADTRASAAIELMVKYTIYYCFRNRH